MGTAPRQTQRSSSFINTKPNLAFHISSNNDRKYFVSTLAIQDKMKTRVAVRVVVKSS